MNELAARYETGIGNVDDSSFGDLLREQRRAALRVATVVLGTAEGADDVVQIATERAWRARARYDAERPFRSWFLRIVANTARNDRRSRGRRAQLAVRAASEGPRDAATPEDDAVTDAERQLVVAALNTLRTSDREVIALRYFEELSEEEMATVLDCATGTVKSRLSRALARLRAVLEEGADDV